MTTTVLDDRWLVARKPHTCEVCLGVIGVGDRYRRQRNIWDGDPGTFKAHALCDAAWWKAWSAAGLYDDESPDRDEEVMPLVQAGIWALASIGAGTTSEGDPHG